jgi:hypothetical protein
MQNEIEIQLVNIKKLINEIESGNLETETLIVADESFREGYLNALLEQKEWLENLIINLD